MQRSGNMDDRSFSFFGRLTCRHHPFLPIASWRSCGNQIGRVRGHCGDFGHYRNRQMIHDLVPAATPWLAPRSLYKIRDKRTNREKIKLASLLVVHPIASTATPITMISIITIVTSATSTWTARVFNTDPFPPKHVFNRHRVEDFPMCKKCIKLC